MLLRVMSVFQSWS